MSEDSIRRLADAIALNAAGTPRTAPRTEGQRDDIEGMRRRLQ